MYSGYDFREGNLSFFHLHPRHNCQKVPPAINAVHDVLQYVKLQKKSGIYKTTSPVFFSLYSVLEFDRNVRDLLHIEQCSAYKTIQVKKKTKITLLEMVAVR